MGWPPGWARSLPVPQNGQPERLQAQQRAPKAVNAHLSVRPAFLVCSQHADPRRVQIPRRVGTAARKGTARIDGDGGLVDTRAHLTPTWTKWKMKSSVWRNRIMLDVLAAGLFHGLKPTTLSKLAGTRPDPAASSRALGKGDDAGGDGHGGARAGAAMYMVRVERVDRAALG